MKYYQSTETLSIYRFNKVLETSDYRFLLHDFNPEDDESSPLEKHNEVILFSVFKTIVKQYEFLSDSSTIIAKLKSEFYIRELEIKIEIGEKILKNFATFDDEVVLSLLNDIKVPFDEGGDAEQQLVSVKRELNGLKTKLSIKRNTYKEKYKKEDSEEGSDIPMSQSAIKISRALELGFEIDLKTTSVDTWIGYLNECKKLKTDG